LGPHKVTNSEVSAQPVTAAKQLAEITGAIVLLKGSTTLVVSPGSEEAPGQVLSQTDGPVWLATAGSGDVLAGVIGALLATGVEPAPAAALGALVHGVAADRANPGGPVRALAVARALPASIASLLRR
jgi:NAD(P)H-hydrate repair Nnr-like enzyme with NAD(P)H-hydrate dehydratase domain